MRVVAETLFKGVGLMVMHKIKFMSVILVASVFSLLYANIAKCEAGSRDKTIPEEKGKNLDIKEIPQLSVSLQGNDSGISQQLQSLPQKKYPKRSDLNNRPNVIIITIDTLRSDHVGCYGYYRNTTPNIDNFSKDAVIFKRAISQSCFTVASMSSFITSAYSYKHILIPIFLDQSMSVVILNPHYPSLGQILKKAGYTNCFISDHSSMFYIKGLKKGFDTFIESEANDPGILTKATLEWISENRKKPFFVWVHYFGPHQPYHPNKIAGLKTPLKEKDKIVPLGKDDTEILGFIAKVGRNAQDTSNNLNYYINNYDGKILLTDEQIGVLLDGIKNLGLDKNSIIVITSDHGEEFGEHNLYCYHGIALYNTLLHVPLLMKIPDQVFTGKLIDETVGLVDVVPTILDLLKIKNPGLDGETILPLINNETAKNKYILSETAEKKSLVCNGWKLIHNIGVPFRSNMRLVFGNSVPIRLKEYELYDLNKDIYEQNNVSEENTEVFNELKDKLTKLEERNKQEMLNKKLLLFRETSDSESTRDIDKEIEKLKHLGYLK